MKRILVLAVVVFVLALMVSSVSAGIRVDPGGANNVAGLIDGSVSVEGGKATPVIFVEAAASHNMVTVDTLKPNPPIPTN